MLLTSIQHRKIAKHLRRKAAMLPNKHKSRAGDLCRSANLHLALARAQERDPQLAPAAKISKNNLPPSQQIKPALVWVRA
jgi:hypothetical protein